MESVKKHQIMVVGLLAAVILGVVALIAIASGEKPVEKKTVLDQGSTTISQEVKTCPADYAKPCFEAKNEVKACLADCTKVCCAAKNAEEKVKSCPFRIPKSCYGKN
ncbi:MAG: hypothetical protein KAS96_07570 [Planctomycetes bacterium]|nr:hypothetical protein [Planctomycetota bacterium]